MNDVPGSVITVGTRLCSDGGIWEVAEMTATGLVLRDALGSLRQAGVGHLLADPTTRLLDRGYSRSHCPTPRSASTRHGLRASQANEASRQSW